MERYVIDKDTVHAWYALGYEHAKSGHRKISLDEVCLDTLRKVEGDEIVTVKILEVESLLFDLWLLTGQDYVPEQTCEGCAHEGTNDGTCFMCSRFRLEPDMYEAEEVSSECI